MKKKLIWRLGKLPTVEELGTLISLEIITKDEAKEILFSENDIDEKTKKDYESEIEFLRRMVDKLSNNNYAIIEKTIREYEPQYRRYNWVYDYDNWTINNSAGNVNACLSSLSKITEEDYNKKYEELGLGPWNGKNTCTSGDSNCNVSKNSPLYKTGIVGGMTDTGGGYVNRGNTKIKK